MMNVNTLNKLLVSIVFFLPSVSLSMYGPNNNLNKYISIAEKNERRQEAALLASTPDLVLSSAAVVAATSAIFLSNPALGSSALFHGFSVLTPEVIYRLSKLQEFYSIKAPLNFAGLLQDLRPLLDPTKSIFIGGKEYMVAKEFNDITHTGYLRKNITLTAAYTAENNTSHSLTTHNQYEIYLMPDDSNLVYTFGEITQVLHNELAAENIAFIAIRPTPNPNNDAKQILPRIVIVLKHHASTANAEQILKITYKALKKEANIKPSGYWPRYSEEIIFDDNAWTPITENLKRIFYIGMGNTDFKSLHPENFERKKFLGITRHGDMAYPINTTAEEKLDTPIIIGK